jgi:hypothetical protein
VLALLVVTVTAMGFATALLICSIAMALLAAGYGDDWPVDPDEVMISNVAAIWLGLWGLWGMVFFFYYRNSPALKGDPRTAAPACGPVEARHL